MYEKRGRRRSADEGVGRELVANLPALCEFKARSLLTHAHSDGALPVAHEARRPWGGGALPPIAPWMAAGAGTEVTLTLILTLTLTRTRTRTLTLTQP